VAVVLLSFALGAADARAGGPGITLFAPNRVQPVTLSGQQIAARANVGPRRYTLRATPGTTGRKLTLRGMSVRGLLQLAGLDPDAINFVTIVRENGSLLALTSADLADPPPFPEGPALVTDEGGTTRFFRPVRDLDGTNAEDSILTSSAGPLEISVDGGGLLAIKARPSRRKVRTGESVSFSARVRFPPTGAQLTYQWDFGDGTRAVGSHVTHVYTIAGDMQAQVSVRGTGGSTARCKTSCGGVATVDVRVGEPPEQPQAADTTPGSGTGNPQAPGSSAGDSAGGRGGSGGGPGTGAAGTPSAAGKPKPNAKREPARAKPPPPSERAAAGPLITGVLLAGEETLPTAKLPAPKFSPATRPGGDEQGLQATRGGSEESAQLGGGVALALLVMGLGALRERRLVKLRVA
jgi:PKD domain